MDVNIDDDPELYASFARALEQILRDFADNWDRIFEEMERLRERIRTAQQEPTYGLDRRRQMPFFRLLRGNLFPDGTPDEDQIALLVDLTQHLYNTVERDRVSDSLLEAAQDHRHHGRARPISRGNRAGRDLDRGDRARRRGQARLGTEQGSPGAEALTLPHPPGKELVSGESLLYLGREYPIEIIDNARYAIRFDDRFLIPRARAASRYPVFREWLKARAEEYIFPRVRERARTLGVPVGSLKITDGRHRWGSCTPKGSLNFNWRLIKADVSTSPSTVPATSLTFFSKALISDQIIKRGRSRVSK